MQWLDLIEMLQNSPSRVYSLNLTFSGEMFSKPLTLFNDNKWIRIQIHKARVSATPSHKAPVHWCALFPAWVLTGPSALCNQQARGAGCGQHLGIQD